MPANEPYLSQIEIDEKWKFPHQFPEGAWRETWNQLSLAWSRLAV